MKLPTLLAAGVLVLALTLTLAATNGEPPPTETTAPPAPTIEADPSVTDPEPTGDIGTALTVECNRGVCHEFEAGPHDGLYLIDGRQVEYWWNQARKAERRVERLLATKQRLLARVAAKLTPTAQEEYAVHLAAIAYGQSEADMRRVVGCESNFYSGAYNSSSGASGIGQFLGGTWRSTPYGHLDVFEPVANALAIGWMWANGRRGEWVCR